MKSAATANGATFVDANPKFSSHRFCDTSDLWFEPFSGTADYNTKQLTYYPPGVFHPTAVGQQSGYEAAFSAAGL